MSFIASAVEEQSITSKDILSNVSHASLGATNMADKINRLSVAANKIAEDIAGVDRSSVDISYISIHVDTTARVLSDMAIQLNERFGRFRI